MKEKIEINIILIYQLTFKILFKNKKKKKQINTNATQISNKKYLIYPFYYFLKSNYIFLRLKNGYSIKPCGLKNFKKIFPFSNFFLTFFPKPIMHSWSLGGFQGLPHISVPVSRARSTAVDEFFVGITTDRLLVSSQPCPFGSWKPSTTSQITLPPLREPGPQPCFLP